MKTTLCIVALAVVVGGGLLLICILPSLTLF